MWFWKRLLFAIFPLMDCNKANKSVKNQQEIIWEKITKDELTSNVQKFIEIDEDNAEYLIKGIRDNINSLQDKAKVTAVAVTLAFSMVGGISGYLLNLKDKFYVNGIITGVLITFVIASCIYLIIAGYFSLLTLNSRQKYDFSPDDFHFLEQLETVNEKKGNKLIMMGQQYEMTTFQNITLNNYVDCSNNNLRNALVSFGIFFSLICLIFVLANNVQEVRQSKTITEQNQIMEDIQTEIHAINKEIKLIKDSMAAPTGQEELNTSIIELHILLEETSKRKIKQ